MVEFSAGIQPKKSHFKKLRKVFVGLLISLLLFSGALIALLFVFQNEVKTAVIGEINKQLLSEVRIHPDDIDLTIIRSFPDCSIRFKNLLMLEALESKNRDTLLFTQKLSLHFNIRDLWQGNYEVQKIKLSDAVVKLKVLKDGKNNYTFWKTDQSKLSDQTERLSFNLKLLSLQDCHLFYDNKVERFNASVQLNQVKFKGNFRDTISKLETELQMHIQELTHQNTVYLKDKKCHLDVNLLVNGKDYSFNKARLRLNQMKLDLNGSFNYSNELKNLKVNYSLSDPDITSVLSLLPEKYKVDINDYQSNGSFYTNGTIDYNNKNHYRIKSEFGLNQATIKYKPTSSLAEQVNLEGQLILTNSSSSLALKNILFNLVNSRISGNCIIENFSDPLLKLTAKGNLDLESLKNFYPIDTLDALKGKVKLDCSIEGKLSALKKHTFSDKVKIDLNCSLSDLLLKFKSDEKTFAIDHCLLIARDREIEVREFALKRGGSDILLNGKIPGFFNYLTQADAPLIIRADLYSNHIEIEDFLAPKKTQSTSDNASIIPSGIQFRLNSTINKLSFGKFEADQLKGELEIKNQKLIISDMTFNAMNGTAEINAYADNSGKQLNIALESSLNNIDISTLFYQMNNFGQSTLLDKNIKGTLNSKINFSGSWTNQLEVDDKSLMASCNINIDNGALVDFKPMLSLSKFVDIQDLQNIRFSTLSSDIRLKDRRIIIPKTSINNSVLNLELWGSHDFDNNIDYHIKMLISDLLAGKRKKHQDEFGPVENDASNKRSAFILMTGTVAKPVIKFDKSSLKEKIKEDIKKEKENIKQLLKEEFSSFKKESESKKTEPSEGTFELEKPKDAQPKKTLEAKKRKTEDDDF